MLTPYDKASEALSTIYFDAETTAPEKIALLDELKESIDTLIEQLQNKPKQN